MSTHHEHTHDRPAYDKHAHDPDPAAIEWEIEQTRARLDRTIDAIEDKLTPAQLLGQVLSFTRSGGGELAGGLASAARTHPMPVTLLSLGAGWMMVAERRRQSAAGLAGQAASRRDGAGTWRQDVGATARQKAHDMQDRAHTLADKARAEGQELREQATQLKDTVMTSTEENIAWMQDTAHKLLQENPLAAGALMMAAGAMIGGALPVSDAERRLFSGKGGQARAAAAQVLERGSQAVQDMAGAALAEGHHIVEDLGDDANAGPIAPPL